METFIFVKYKTEPKPAKKHKNFKRCQKEVKTPLI